MGKRWANLEKHSLSKRTMEVAEKPTAFCLFCHILVMAVVLLGCGAWAATGHAQNASPASSSQPAVGTAWEIAVQRAQEHIKYGLNLGSRQAIYSAQAEFLQALRIIARELDIASHTQVHEVALTEGWYAIDTLDLAKPNSPSPTSAQEASGLSDQTAAYRRMQQQLGNAQQKLALCGEHEPTASMALFALGRSYVAAAEESPEERALCMPKAIALYQAALAVDAKNYMAVNELSVLLAKCGQLQEAERVLMQGVAVAPQPQIWHNLAAIHEKLGNAALAQEDRRQRDALLAARGGKAPGTATAGLAAVQWVEPAEFARRSGNDDLGLPTKKDVTASPLQQGTASEPTSTKNTRSLLPNWITSEFKKSEGEESGEATR